MTTFQLVAVILAVFNLPWVVAAIVAAVSLYRDGTVDCYLGQRADEERWRRRAER